MTMLCLRQALRLQGRALSTSMAIDMGRCILYLAAVGHLGLGGLLNIAGLTAGSAHADVRGLSLRRLADQVVARLLLEVDVLLLYLEWLVWE